MKTIISMLGVMLVDTFSHQVTNAYGPSPTSSRLSADGMSVDVRGRGRFTRSSIESSPTGRGSDGHWGFLAIGGRGNPTK